MNAPAQEALRLYCPARAAAQAPTPPDRPAGHGQPGADGARGGATWHATLERLDADQVKLVSSCGFVLLARTR